MRSATSVSAGNAIMENNPAGYCDRRFQGKRVLLVDDDIDLLLTWEELLRAQDYETATAENGVKALKVIQGRGVDAVLCDLDMPELTGDLLYMEVCRTWPELVKRFIFITGNVQNPTYEGFLKSISVSVLSKPVAFDRLLGELRSTLTFV